MHDHHYRNLLIMTVLSFVSMYIFMYAMVNAFANVYSHLNQVYMAGLMTAPMVLIELAVMRSMYKNAMANIAIAAISVVALLAFFAAIQQQTAIGDTQLLRSMIPHHAGAILMCEEASLEDAELKTLCAGIIEDQRSEIAVMESQTG